MLKKILLTATALAAGSGLSLDRAPYIEITKEHSEACKAYYGGRCEMPYIFGILYNADPEYVEWCMYKSNSCDLEDIADEYWNNRCRQWSGSNLTYGQMKHKQEMCLLHECISTDWPDIYHTQTRYTLKCED